MRVLVITTEFPTPDTPGGGVFIYRQIDALRDVGVDVDVLAFRSHGNPLNHYRAWRKLRRMLREKDYDLIHGHFAHSVIGARLQFKLPIVVTYRGDEAYGIISPKGRYTVKGFILKLIAQVIALLVDELIVVSEAMGQRIWRKDYTVIPSGLKLDLIKPIPRDEARRELGWSLDQPVVLFAVLDITSPRKRYPLAKAAVDLANQELDIPAELRIATGLSPEEMPLYLNASDVLLLTSVHEGSPNVVKEALACNVPVVSVDVGDVRERMEGVNYGAVCEPTPEALAAALIPLLREPRRSNGRQAVESLSDPILAQKVIEIYRRVLGHNV